MHVQSHRLSRVRSLRELYAGDSTSHHHGVVLHSVNTIHNVCVAVKEKCCFRNFVVSNSNFLSFYYGKCLAYSKGVCIGGFPGGVQARL